jgi:hypothetical protein
MLGHSRTIVVYRDGETMTFHPFQDDATPFQDDATPSGPPLLLSYNGVHYDSLRTGAVAEEEARCQARADKDAANVAAFRASLLEAVTEDPPSVADPGADDKATPEASPEATPEATAKAVPKATAKATPEAAPMTAHEAAAKPATPSDKKREGAQGSVSILQSSTNVTLKTAPVTAKQPNKTGKKSSGADCKPVAKQGPVRNAAKGKENLPVTFCFTKGGKPCQHGIKNRGYCGKHLDQKSQTRLPTFFTLLPE